MREWLDHPVTKTLHLQLRNRINKIQETVLDGTVLADPKPEVALARLTGEVDALEDVMDHDYLDIILVEEVRNET